MNILTRVSNKVVSNLTGEQKSSRRCVSSPDLPALCPYFTDEVILENRRVTKKKGVQLPELDIEHCGRDKLCVRDKYRYSCL